MTRRSLFQWLAHAFHGLTACIVAAPILRFVFIPHGGTTATRGFQRIAPFSLTNPGRPVRITVSADRTDGFIHYPPGPIGVVWLVRNPDGAGSSDNGLRCFQSICPHLGCAINFARDRGVFFCPCHASEFAADGARNFGPAPRNMDELPCRIAGPDDDGQRWVEIQYREFRTGTQQPIPKA